MNKKLSSILSIGCAVAFAFSMTSCNNGTSNTGNQSITPVSTTGTDAKLGIAFVNIDTLLDQYEYFKEVRTSLEDKAKKAQTDLQNRSLAFQREINEYQEKAATMSAADRQSTEERLARKQDELARHQQNASSSFAQDESEENEKLYAKITEYLKVYAKENGYQYVLTYSALNPNILYADESMNITSDVLKTLNEQHASSKKK